MSRRALVLAAVVAAASFTGCSKGADAVDRLDAALATTGDDALEVVYRSTEGGVEQVVTLTIDDSYRYRATLAVDGRPVYEEIARDDSLAARVLDPVALDILRRPPVTADATSKEPVVDPAALAASENELRAGRWVLDQVGAPEVLGAPAAGAATDPILEARALFDYLATQAHQSGAIRLDTDSLSYRPNQDPFPHPDADKGEVRFDVTRQGLPALGSGDAGAPIDPPIAANLRKLSVYVRDRRVVGVREIVEIGDRGDDLVSRYDLPISTGAADDAVLAAVNELRTRRGLAAIRLHTVVAEVRRTAAAVPDLPGDAVIGSLQLLRGRGSATGRAPKLT